ncbi:translation initiation factor IF-1 [Prosthecobacter fluviatilis]|uniref:Translation initiation factor IF-1 n=1 Tax=Prosthecobacter fluviatilis TaxID=445931 RepID=A0ABW0KRQ9_9BACT
MSRPPNRGPSRSGPSNRGPSRGGPPNRGPSRGGPPRYAAPPPRPPEPEETGKQKEEAIELEGTIAAVLAGTMFRVKLRNGHEVLAHISGKMRKKFIRLVIGDAVKIEMSPYDMDKARIVYRIG